MKHVAMFAFLMLVGNLVFAQKSVDPSYSVNNYKHANKAAYAKKHNLDKSSKSTTVTVADSWDYKHPNNTVMASKSSFSTLPADKSGRTEKHPLGL